MNLYRRILHENYFSLCRTNILKVCFSLKIDKRKDFEMISFIVGCVVTFFACAVEGVYQNITELIKEISPAYPDIFDSDNGPSTLLELDDSSSILLQPSYLLLIFATMFCSLIWRFLT